MELPLLGLGAGWQAGQLLSCRNWRWFSCITWKCGACVHLNITIYPLFGIFTWSAFSILSDSISRFTVNVCYLNGLIQMQGAHCSWVGWFAPSQGSDRDLLSVTRSANYLHHTCLEPLIGFSRRTLLLDFSLPGWFPAGETSALGPLARRAHPRGLSSSRLRFHLAASPASAQNQELQAERGPVSEIKCSFSLQLLNYLWKWTIVKHLKLALCLCTLTHWFSNLAPRHDSDSYVPPHRFWST